MRAADTATAGAGLQLHVPVAPPANASPDALQGCLAPTRPCVLYPVSQVAGDRQRYLAGYFVPSRHRFHFTAQGVVSRGDQPLCSGA